jgi:hypothetical protein
MRGTALHKQLNGLQLRLITWFGVSHPRQTQYGLEPQQSIVAIVALKNPPILYESAFVALSSFAALNREIAGSDVTHIANCAHRKGCFIFDISPLAGEQATRLGFGLKVQALETSRRESVLRDPLRRLRS